MVNYLFIIFNWRSIDYVFYVIYKILNNENNLIFFLLKERNYIVRLFINYVIELNWLMKINCKF